jgi:hypothetical protein
MHRRGRLQRSRKQLAARAATVRRRAGRCDNQHHLDGDCRSRGDGTYNDHYRNDRNKRRHDDGVHIAWYGDHDRFDAAARNARLDSSAARIGQHRRLFAPQASSATNDRHSDADGHDRHDIDDNTVIVECAGTAIKSAAAARTSASVATTHVGRRPGFSPAGRAKARPTSSLGARHIMCRFTPRRTSSSSRRDQSRSSDRRSRRTFPPLRA